MQTTTTIATPSSTAAEIAQKPETFKATLPNGRKLTINSDYSEVVEHTEKSLLNVKAGDRTSAAEALRNGLIENTDAEDRAEADAYVSQQKEAEVAQTFTYSVPEKFEYTVSDGDEAIEPRGRAAYVWYFKAHQRRTAIASLQMCRVVYEASKTLPEHEFDEFCKNIGYKPDSSAVRKFMVVGKVYPRLINYADQLPAAWTSIYALTQIPADEFERCIEAGYRLCDLSGSEIDQLVKKTRNINKLESPFKKDKKIMGICFAKGYVTKQLDDTDLHLIKKAFQEIEARLPVKLVISKELLEIHDARVKQRYEALKQEVPDAAVKPQEWDYGTAANSVYVKNAA